MAYIVPSDIKKIEFSHGSGYELETLAFLQKHLPSDYTVFHGVHWSHEYQSWTHFGEIDFVILNKNGKVLFIEQKNGPLEELGGKLVKFYGAHSKDVADQIHRSIDKVREKFQWSNGKSAKLSVDYLIYCPDYLVKGVNAAGINITRVVDSSKKDQLATIIQDLCSCVANETLNYKKLESFFYQSFNIVPDIHAHKDKLDKSFVRQSGSLVSILSNLEMNPFRLRIMGTAGSGKSLVVQSYMEKEAMQNKRILFLCFNRLLAEKRRALWQSAHSDNSIIQTFYGFCIEFLNSQGMPLNYDRMYTEPHSFWQEVLELVMSMKMDEAWQFDTLVVDEGQDFQDDWYEIAKLFLKDNASILWLEDSRQKLVLERSVELDSFVKYHCHINYRTPESIARFILKTLPVQFEIGNFLPGLGVDTHAYQDENEQPKQVAHLVHQLIKQGFSLDDIYIVSCKGAKKSIFGKLDKVGSFFLSHFTGRYDDKGQQLMTDGELRFDSIYRFKGLESPAVILVDVDFDKPLNKQQENLLFCCMTRATVKLDIFFNSGKAASNQLFK